MGGARPPAVAGLFYPRDEASCREEIRRCLAAAPRPSLPPGARVAAALAPHAGWTFCGTLAAAALAPLVAEDPDTVVLFGADHHGLGRGATVHPGPEWGTPLGPAPVDGVAAAALAAGGGAPVASSAEVHAPEHSIEVLVPFLRVLLPRARILPVIVPPGRGAATGAAARRACDALGRRSVALGSTDLTHYGARYGFEPRGRGAEAHRWSREENDRDFLLRALALDPAGMEASARSRRNACGPGAAAAAAAFAAEAGADRGLLLAHTTSAEAMGDASPDLWVGYAALLFLAGRPPGKG